MGKLKGIDWKELVLKYADKAVFGVCALLAAMALWGSTFGVYKGEPVDIISKVKQERTALNSPQNLWPVEKRMEFSLTEDQAPMAVVETSLKRPVSFRPRRA